MALRFVTGAGLTARGGGMKVRPPPELIGRRSRMVANLCWQVCCWFIHDAEAGEEDANEAFVRSPYGETMFCHAGATETPETGLVLK